MRDIFNAVPRTCSRHRQKVPDCQPSQEFWACESSGREPRREFSVPRFFFFFFPQRRACRAGTSWLHGERLGASLNGQVLLRHAEDISVCPRRGAAFPSKTSLVLQIPSPRWPRSGLGLVASARLGSLRMVNGVKRCQPSRGFGVSPPAGES